MHHQFSFVHSVPAPSDIFGLLGGGCVSFLSFAFQKRVSGRTVGSNPDPSRHYRKSHHTCRSASDSPGLQGSNVLHFTSRSSLGSGGHDVSLVAFFTLVFVANIGKCRANKVSTSARHWRLVHTSLSEKKL